MYVLIISAVLILTIAILNGKSEKPFSWGYFGFSVFVGAVVYVIMALIILVIHSSSDKFHVREYRDQPIESFHLDKQNHISGDFFLGCGVIEGGDYDYYVSYARFPKGLLKVKCDAYSTYLRETDSTATIKKYWVRTNYTGFRSKWIGNTYPNEGKWQVNDGEKTIVVPLNTVYLEFQTVE